MTSSFRHYFLLLPAFALALAAGYGAVRAQQAPAPFLQNFASFEAYDPPLPAPSLVFYDLKGGAVRMDELKGKWRLVNLWATWCPSCITEIPLLLALEENYRNSGFDVVFVSLDQVESAADLEQRLKRVRVPDTIGTLYNRDTGVWDKLGLSALPTSFIIDPAGRLHYKLVGDTDWTAQESLEFIGKLMNN